MDENHNPESGSRAQSGPAGPGDSPSGPHAARAGATEEMFRTLAEVAPFGIAILSFDEKTEYLNPKFTEIFGYTIEEVPDFETWFRIAYPDENRRLAAASLWRREVSGIRNREWMSAEADPKRLRMQCKDGKEKIISFRAVVLADGKVIATFLDATAEAKAELELQRAEKEWELTFNAVSDLVYILDTHQKIVRINRAMADRLEMDPSAIVGMTFRDIDRAEKTLTSLSSSTDSVTARQERFLEIEGRSSGAIFDVRTSPLIDERGQYLGSVYVARDVTALKRLDRARRRAVHHLSHELTTPLAIIKGSVRKLESRQLSPELREASFKRIERSLDRLSEIQQTVKEIVFPRPYHPMTLSVEQAVRQIVEGLCERCPHRSVVVVFRMEHVEADFVDPEVLGQVVETLVKNAIENTPDEAQIMLSLKRDCQGILLTVQDGGVGINGEDQPFLFEAFYHTQPTDFYSTRRPFDFNAGGKGLELLRLKILSENGFFEMSVKSQRCRYLGGNKNTCPGRVSLCPHVNEVQACAQAGGSTFSALFRASPSHVP